MVTTSSSLLSSSNQLSSLLSWTINNDFHVVKSKGLFSILSAAFNAINHSLHRKYFLFLVSVSQNHPEKYTAGCLSCFLNLGKEGCSDQWCRNRAHQHYKRQKPPLPRSHILKVVAALEKLHEPGHGPASSSEGSSRPRGPGVLEAWERQMNPFLSRALHLCSE